MHFSAQNLTDIVSRRICAIDLMIALSYRQEQEVPHSNRSSRVSSESPKDEPPKDQSLYEDPFPLVCKKTQCIICIGDDRSTYEYRTRTYATPHKMMNHRFRHPRESPVLILFANLKGLFSNIYSISRIMCKSCMASAFDSSNSSDAVRDLVMRHDPFTGVFNGAYINNIVRFNVQDSFLESEISDDGLTRAFTHMSIRCNPGVPKEVPTEMMNSLLAADPDVVNLERQFKKLYAQIKGDYKFIRCAPKTIRMQYEDLRKNLMNAKKSLKDEIEKEFRKDYFFRVHNEMMKQQLHRQSSKTVGDKEEDTPII
ncbi:hypothetical protein CJF30_00011443 [Rutstroemia sp. NJR-2017a BBW]|nr:hypothetical protein CJF30_00011443 [Rutstroemia sp. NJR-2017a BBW]